MTIYLLFILLSPLIGFFINIFLGKRFSVNISGIVASACVLVPFIVSLFLLLSINNDMQSNHYTIYLFQWINIGMLNIPFEFFIDALSIWMMIVVTGVSTVIHFYSIGYMHEDERFSTFFAWLNLFVFFMLILVAAANYLIMFIGWEGVGLCSYLLIGFWSHNNDFNNAARKAFIMNRIGDLGFLIALFMMIFLFGSLSFDIIFSSPLLNNQNNIIITILTILLLIGALGKSAQFPLYTWLPDAMAGPTPVSALIHAATMVTAGIYMIVRSHILFSLAPFTLNLIIFIGLFTAAIAAIIAVYQNDIKKILAYSTISQLGYMFLAIGLSAYSSAIFHLTTHAFFKALLFLAAGSIIHALNGEQNIKNMGGLKKYMPITFYTFLIACLAIVGIPPFSGFFSKDEILAKTFEHSHILWMIAVLVALITCFYMFRLLYLVFYKQYRGNLEIKLHESSKIITIPLIILAILSFSGGIINIPYFFGGNNYLANFLNIPVHKSSLNIFTEYTLLLFTLMCILGTIMLAYYKYIRVKNIPIEHVENLNFIEKIIYNKFYIDEIYNFIFVKPYNLLSEKIFTYIENEYIDYTVNSSGNFLFNLGLILRRLQTGNISSYIIFMTISVAIFLLINLFNN
jgi:NADH-quinone oxidoreductase subunit L